MKHKLKNYRKFYLMFNCKKRKDLRHSYWKRFKDCYLDKESSDSSFHNFLRSLDKNQKGIINDYKLYITQILDEAIEVYKKNGMDLAKQL